MRLFYLANLAAITALPALCQPAIDLPSFEVVSIKPSAMTDGHYGAGLFTFPGGRVLANECKIDFVVELAFDMQRFQIAGGPRWIREDRFDIEAKPPASSKSSDAKPLSFKSPPNPEQRLMLQSMLVDRFHFRYHRETKEGPVYLLVRNNKPLNLEPAKDRNEYPWVGSVGGGALSRDGIRGMNASMQLLAERLSSNLERPVIDRTGLEGSFDFKYKYESDDAAPDLSAAIMTYIQGLGLKLEASRGPVETLAIDGVEKPVAN
jgi:uncharacterized protein (TIGR03435 family)